MNEIGLETQNVLISKISFTRKKKIFPSLVLENS